MKSRSLPHALLLVAILYAVGAISGCSGDPPSSPELSEILAAKGGNGGGKGGGGGNGGNGPTVDGADPDNAPQGVTLDVRVFGSGYDETSDVTFLLDGKATKDVKTNATQFVSSEELVANITITDDAPPVFYDIQASSRRGKGVGIELFKVTGPTADLADRPAGLAPAGLYNDGRGPYVGWWNVNPQGQDEGNFNVQAHCSENRSMDLELPKDGNGNAVWSFNGPVIDCDVQFHVPDLLNAQCPGGNCPIGGAPDGSNYAPSVFYFFRADTTNKRGKLDDSYNVVWTNAVFDVLWAVDGTSCAWQVTGSIADLYKRPDILEQPTGQAVALDVTITRVDGPCAF